MFIYAKDVVKSDLDKLIARDIPFEKLKNKTVLVTGATGMLAGYFTMTLMHLNIVKNYNIKVLALARTGDKPEEKFSGFLNDPNFVILEQDVCEPINYDGDINYIFHAAGPASPYFIKNFPTTVISANTQGTVNILELARTKNVENIIYPSTREVYGEVKDTELIKETDMGTFDPMDARSCYPESKRMAETILKSYLVEFGVPFTVMRIAHSYGPGMIIGNDGRVMSDFITNAVNRTDIVMKSEGLAERAFCYVTDAVAALFTVMLKGKIGEAYNLANETEPMAIRDVAQLIADSFPERNIKVVFEIESDTSGYCNYKRVGLDTTKLEALGWKPEISLKEGLVNTVISFD